MNINKMIIASLLVMGAAFEISAGRFVNNPYSNFKPRDWYILRTAQADHKLFPQGKPQFPSTWEKMKNSMSATLEKVKIYTSEISFSEESVKEKFPFAIACKNAVVEFGEEVSTGFKNMTDKASKTLNKYGVVLNIDEELEVPAVEVPAVEVPAVEVPATSFIARNKYALGGIATLAFVGTVYYAYTKYQENKKNEKTK